MTKHLFVRSAFGLTASDEAAREALTGIAIGTTVCVEVSRPRNVRFLRLYWSMCSCIADSIGAERETISDVLKIKTNHVRIIKTRDGLLEFPASISFAKMREPDFKRFFDRCCQVICSEWLPHMKPSDFKKQVEQMVGLPTSEAA